jgi:hypothetical protein
MTVRNERDAVTEPSKGADSQLFPRTPLFIGGVAVCFGFLALAFAGIMFAWPRPAVLSSEAVGWMGVGAFSYSRTRTKKAMWFFIALMPGVMWAATLVIH